MLYITGVSKCQKCHFLKVLFLSWINKQSYAETARHKINKWSKGLWFFGPCSSKYVAIGKKSKLV